MKHSISRATRAKSGQVIESLRTNRRCSPFVRNSAWRAVNPQPTRTGRGLEIETSVSVQLSRKKIVDRSKRREKLARELSLPGTERFTIVNHSYTHVANERLVNKGGSLKIIRVGKGTIKRSRLFVSGGAFARGLNRDIVCTSMRGASSATRITIIIII